MLNFYKVVKTSEDTDTVSLDITDRSFRNSASIIVAGQAHITGCCVQSDVAANVGKAYSAIVNFVVRNDAPFLLIDDVMAYEYDGMGGGVVVAVNDGTTDIGISITGVDFATTNNLFIWTASYYLTYIDVGVGA